MRITPLEIQQMVFKTRLRGYDREDVDRFLEDLARTVESLNRENADLRDKLGAVERHLSEVKKAESTLASTLVSAQAVGEDLKQSAQRDAELIVKEAELKASELVREARAELATTHRELADLRKQRLVMVERLRSTLRTFERLLEVEEESTSSEQADSTDHAERIA